MVIAARELQYEQIPSGLYVATTKALNEAGKPIVGIKWYLTKEWTQARGLVLPYSREWSEARAYFQSSPDIERDMINGPAEWTDSLIAHPNRDGNYASNLNNPRLPGKGKGKYVLLIEGSTIEKRNNGSYVIDGGEVIILSFFPGQTGCLLRPIPELGLLQDSYLYTGSDFSYDEGLRPVIRGDRWHFHGDYFDANANVLPSGSYADFGFRPARRGLVGTETETDFVRVPRNEYESLRRDSEKLEKIRQTPD